MASEKELIALVKERFGVGIPQWRKSNTKKGLQYDARAYSKAEKAEQKALIDHICKDDGFLNKFAVYFGYCDILVARGFASSRDLVTKPDVADWHEKVRRNFAKCQIEAIYHDMCCDPETILGHGSGDGYWIYLDRPYLDICHMKVGNAILNLEEVWAVIDGILDEWDAKCQEREAGAAGDIARYNCDRCGKAIYGYGRSGCRFDVYENLLHCPKCVKECTHWANIDKAARRG